MNAAHWADYWTSRAKSTISDLDRKSYGAELEQRWKDVVANHISEGDIVDLACGNGDVAVQVFNYLRAEDISKNIFAIDYAEIALTEDIQGSDAIKEIKWLENTHAENLPLATNSISLVVSQFGFEYTNTNKTIEELTRILKVGGTLSFLIHSDDSFISQKSSKEIECYEAMLYKEKLFSIAKELILLAKDEKGSKLAEQTRKKFNDKLAIVYDLFAKEESLLTFLSAVKQQLSALNSIHFEDLKMKFTKLEESYAHHYHRLKHMRSSIYTATDVENLKDLLVSKGFNTVELIKYRNHLGTLGWWITMTKQKC